MHRALHPPHAHEPTRQKYQYAGNAGPGALPCCCWRCGAVGASLRRVGAWLVPVRGKEIGVGTPCAAAESSRLNCHLGQVEIT